MNLRGTTCAKPILLGVQLLELHTTELKKKTPHIYVAMFCSMFLFVELQGE